MEPITVKATIDAGRKNVWTAWTTPDHVINWNHASDDWHTPHAENELTEGGKFTYRMEAKDGSMAFDFTGVFTKVEPSELLVFRLDDGRMVEVNFVEEGDKTTVVESFDPHPEQPLELQRQGWQAIMDNFKKYVEALRQAQE